MSLSRSLHFSAVSPSLAVPTSGKALRVSWRVLEKRAECLPLPVLRVVFGSQLDRAQPRQPTL